MEQFQCIQCDKISTDSELLKRHMVNAPKIVVEEKSRETIPLQASDIGGKDIISPSTPIFAPITQLSS